MEDSYSSILRPTAKLAVLIVLTETPKNMLENGTMTLKELVKLINMWCQHEGWEPFKNGTITHVLVEMEKEGLIERKRYFKGRQRVVEIKLLKRRLPIEIGIRDIAIAAGKPIKSLRRQIRELKMLLQG